MSQPRRSRLGSLRDATVKTASIRSIAERLQISWDRLTSPPERVWEKDGFRYWQERILRSFLLVGVLLGIIPYVLSSWYAVQHALTPVFFLSTAAMGTGLYLLLSPRPSFLWRAFITLANVHFIGLYVLYFFGMFSGGPAWLFFFAVLAALLLGLRAAMLAVVLNGVAFAAITALSHLGVIATGPISPHSPARTVGILVNFLMINAMTGISVAVMVHALKKMVERATAAKNQILAEREALRETEARLKAEVEIRRETEKALRHSEQRHRVMAESIHDVIWGMDLTMHYTYIGPAATRVHGWSAEELKSITVDRVLTPDSLQKAADAIASRLAALENGAPLHWPHTLDLEMYRKDGSTFWTEVTASILLGDDGRPVGVIGVTRDITERRRERLEREALQAALERSKKMEAMGMLAGGVAHDLNNILSGAVSYPELLLMDLPADSPLRKPLETIQSSGQRAAAVVADLLTVARGAASAREVNNLNAIVEKYLAGPAFGQLEIRYPSVQVTTQLDQDLLNLRCSTVHIEKTLMNLVTNAMEAIDGSGMVRIATQNRYLESVPPARPGLAPGEFVVLTVTDNGPGISDEDRQRIFEPFYSRKVMGRSGTGLGLAVVWSTVQDHGGFIDCASGPQGTRFTVWLPATREAAAEQADDGQCVTPTGKGEFILVVDDEELQRKIAVAMLHRLGYRAEAAASGREALAFLDRQAVDLVLLDMVMPEMDGLATYRQMLQRHPGQRALIASGYAATANVREAQRLGAGAYLRKPYTLRQLSEHLRRELHASPKGSA